MTLRHVWLWIFTHYFLPPEKSPLAIMITDFKYPLVAGMKICLIQQNHLQVWYYHFSFHQPTHIKINVNWRWMHWSICTQWTVARWHFLSVPNTRIKLTTPFLQTATKSLPSCPKRQQKYSEGLIALSLCCQMSRVAGRGGAREGHG